MAQSIRPFSPLFSPFLPFSPLRKWNCETSVKIYGAVLCTLWSSALYPMEQCSIPL